MQWLSSPFFCSHFIALISGALAVFSLSPFKLWPLALVSVGLFYWLLRELTPKQAFWRGWYYGFGLFLAGVHWVYVSIHDYGAASPLLAGFLTLIFCAGLAFLPALTAYLWARCLRLNQRPIIDTLAFAALWTLQEVFRSWFLGGFPWLYMGYSQLNAPLAGLFPIGGVWLASFILALSAALFVALIILRKKPLPLSLALILLITPWLVGLALKDYLWTKPQGAPLSIAAMQGNVPQQLKWQPEQLQAQLDLYARLTTSARHSDLMIWPEAAIPVLKQHIEPYLTQISAFSRKQNSALITGVPLREDKRYYNAVIALGEGSGTYLKQKLVPFGEYVPLENLLRGIIAFFDLPMSSFSAGEANQAPLIAKDHTIAPLICYEVVYPELARRAAAHSELLLTLSNDAWFGRSIGPWQHLQMAQARALESGRWLIRATNNGITALINPFGQITQQIPQFEQRVLYGQVQPMQGQTPWLKWGNWPLLALCGLILVTAVIVRCFKKSDEVVK